MIKQHLVHWFFFAVYFIKSVHKRILIRNTFHDSSVFRQTRKTLCLIEGTTHRNRLLSAENVVWMNTCKTPPRNTAGRTALYGDFAGSLISTFYGYRDTLLHIHVQWVVWNLQLFSRWKTIIDQQSGQTMWHIIFSYVSPLNIPLNAPCVAYTCQRCQKWSPHVGEYPTDGASRMFVSWIIFFG